MTDHPGGGYGGRPDDGGQQPGYGQEGYGQQYGQPAYGNPVPPPGYGPPRRKNTNAIIAGIVAVVVVAGGIIAAVLLTGGGGDSKKANGSGAPTVGTPRSGFPSASTNAGTSIGAGGGGSSVSSSDGAGAPSSVSVPTLSTPAGGGGGAATGVYYTISYLVDEYFGDLDDQYYEGITELTCQGYSTRLTNSDVDEVTDSTVTSPAKISGTTALAAGTVKLSDGSSRTLTITMSQQSDEKWCVSGESAMR